MLRLIVNLLLVAWLAAPIWAAENSAMKPAQTTAASKADSAADSKTTAAKSTPSKAPAASAAARAKLPQVDRINDEIHKGWIDRGVRPSQPATDGEWCRRVYLDVLGRVPSVDELTKFLADKSTRKRYDLVDRLLGSEYNDEYARNWSAVWTNILIGRTGGSDNNPIINRAALTQYCRDALGQNKPYNAFMTDLLTATGANDAKGNGAVNFLTAKLADRGVQATAKTAQVFLGVQVQCTQCHDHPFNNWKQNQFWELAAFFRQTAARPQRGPDKRVASFTLVDQNFPGEGGGERRDRGKAEMYYELRNGTMKVAYPVFIDGTEINPSGNVAEVDRRVELAKLIAASPNMPRALVNRMWAHFLGYGFTKPVDDMGPHNPPTHPELLDALAGDFKESHYDLKELIRWIVLSEPYALSSRFNARNLLDDPSLGERPAFSHFYLRQMRLEELYESLITATEAAQLEASAQEREDQKRDWLRQFTFAFGTDDNEETTTFNGTIPQVLMMFNGPLTRTATRLTEDGSLQRIAADDSMDSKQKITHLYLAALARRPTTAELDEANRLWAAHKGNVAEALSDVWWALLNSNEFILNH